MIRRDIIITADDFGMSPEVNEAVEEAHRKGVLSSASLVVTGKAAADAIERARRMPDLGVGLHLALVAAPPASDPATIPDLLGPDREGLGLSPEMVGAKIALSRRVRDQARQEIRAQLDLFRATGLRLDHVDGHWHFHQHPEVVRLLVSFAPAYGLRAMRVPFEPPLASWRAGQDRFVRRTGKAVLHLPLAFGMQRACARAGIRTNDWFFGMNDGGHIDRDRLLDFIEHCPAGTTEIGLHPATRSWRDPFAPPESWRPADELAALLDPEVASALRGGGRRLIRFGDLSRGHV